MNSADTPARTSGFDASFTDGAGKGVTSATSGRGAGNTPATIAARKDSRGFKGSTNQPLRKGVRRKFIDENINHPRIPKSNYTPATLDTIPAPGGFSGGPRGGDQNSQV